MMTTLKGKACCVFLLSLLFFGHAVKAQKGANFLASPVSGCAPLVVRFTDSSSNNPTQWKWNLGNGTISYLQNPSVTYFNPGKYTIKLIASNSTGADSIIKTQYVTVYAQPVVDFTADINTGCYPLPVQFTDQSKPGNDTINLWQWDFGDGASSALQNPKHVYTSSGNYNITLRVRNTNGCLTTLSKTQFIKINAGVKAAFGHNNVDNCTFPVVINFTNQSTGTGTLSYKWFFGDGLSSALQNPLHTYNALGRYDVQLVVTNALGCTDTVLKTQEIIVSKVKASFNIPDTICTKQPVVFNNTSAPAPLSSTWYFSDSTLNDVNPTTTFTTPGNYTIKLKASFGTCTDSVTKVVTVAPKPLPAFVTSVAVSCSTPFNVQFTNQSVNSINFKWAFGDGTFSSFKNPVHTYTTPGNYTVQLVAINAGGCSDTIQKINCIQILKLKASLQNLPDSGCVPFTKSFAANINTMDIITNYRWDFGDGTTSYLPNPIHTYTTAGAFKVSLIIQTASGCSDTVMMNRAVITNIKPVANFSVTPLNTCAKNKIFFTDLTPGPVNTWLWIFGDGGIAEDQNPTHNYMDTGKFTIGLIVGASGCADTLVIKNYLQINAPVAKFISVYDCTKSLERSFKDQSIGADEWSWNFGDGSTSSEQNPVHLYSLQGFYDVALTVKNHHTGCDFIYTKNIQVLNVKADFTAANPVICKTGNVTFNSNLSPVFVNSWEWYFGDSSYLYTKKSPVSHIYKNSGNYNVVLITTDMLGCRDTVTKISNIRVNGPVAAFSTTAPGACLQAPVVFNDSSLTDNVNNIKTYDWDYGDGTTASVSGGPFQHVFTNPGAYIVKLTVTDVSGCSDSFSMPAAFIISKPVAQFTNADTVSCPTKPVRFTGQSTGPGLTYLWNLGNGSFASAQNPVCQYAANGTYSVKLLITDKYGCMDSVTKRNYITIVTPSVDFKISDSLSACPPLIVQTTDLSKDALTKTWDFGDGSSTASYNPTHFYSYPGHYTVTFTVASAGGCTVAKQRSVFIKGPTGTFRYSPLVGCNPVTSNFNAKTSDVTSIIWDFNDGNVYNTKDTFAAHTYTYPGSYIPKLILTDSDGCKVPIKGLDTITVNGITAAFNFTDKIVCDAGSVAFTDSSFSNDVINTYNWTFGDGGTASVPNPVYTYGQTGLYYPALTITSLYGCKGSFTSATPVKVIASPHIGLSNTANGCTPLQVTFKGQVTVSDTSALQWKWDFANGNYASVQNPAMQQYNKAGVYTVILSATNSNGCTTTATKTIEAYKVPQVSAGADTFICKQRGIILNAAGADTYSWLPAKGLSCNNCQSPVATPDSATSYTVKGSTVHGCTATATVRIAVQYPFKITYSPPDTLCKGESAKLFLNGASNYTWQPATGITNGNTSTPTAQPDNTTNYTIIGSDDKNCFKDTGHIFIKVYPIPVVNGGGNKVVNVGKTIDLIPTISADVTEVLWSPTTGIFRNSYPGITIKPVTNTDYTVKVKNPGGCFAEDKVSVKVICNGTNVFIPNTFSPNGDGANDIFYPRGSGLFKIATLRIFSRWGQVVFERKSFNANDPNAGWDGTFNGARLNPDVYVYSIDIICDNNSILNYKGNIALVQ